MFHVRGLTWPQGGQNVLGEIDSYGNNDHDCPFRVN